MPRRKAEQEDLSLHLTFRVSPDLRKKLVDASEGRALGDEIRRRLEASFAGAAPTVNNPMYSNLVRAIAEAATFASTLDAGGFDPFEDAVLAFLKVYRPEGTTKYEITAGNEVAAYALAKIDDLAALRRVMAMVKAEKP